MPFRAGEVEWHEGELAKKVNLGTIQHFVVNEYERCLFIRDGKIQQEFGAGRHATTSMPFFGTSKHIYVSLRPFDLKWGLPETFSKDNVRVGAFGTIELQINDPKMFYAQRLGASGKEAYTIQDLREDLLDNIQGVIRSELANLEVKQIYIERDILISVVRAKLTELFASFGCDYKRLEIQGVNIPEDIKKALESLKIHSITMQKDEGDMTLEMKKLKMMQEMGIDAAKMKELEIMEKDPSVLGKKYESAAYKDAFQASRTQNVNVGMAMPPPQQQQPVYQPPPQQAPPPAAAPAGDGGIEAKLEKLKKFMDQGLITEEEFAAKKKELLMDL